MSIFSLALCLLTNTALYYYFADYFSGRTETQARVSEIQKVKNRVGGKSGYSIQL
jgi:hypothetical protein